MHADSHGNEQRQHGDKESRFEIRRANRDFPGIQCFQNERIDRPEKDQAGSDTQQNIVDQQKALSGKWLKADRSIK